MKESASFKFLYPSYHMRCGMWKAFAPVLTNFSKQIDNDSKTNIPTSFCIKRLEVWDFFWKMGQPVLVEIQVERQFWAGCKPISSNQSPAFVAPISEIQQATSFTSHSNEKSYHPGSLTQSLHWSPHQLTLHSGILRQVTRKNITFTSPVV